MYATPNPGFQLDAWKGLMTAVSLEELLDRFMGVPVLAVGDIYLDENTFGVVNEVSLEAPIPVFEVHERRYNPGAAGNAACNAASLGGKVSIVGVIGADMNGDIVKRAFAERGVDTSGLVVDPHRPTNTYGKLRAACHNAVLQEVLRTDTPKPDPLEGAIEDAVCATIRDRAPSVKAILIGDQVGSVITPKVLATIQECAKAHNLVTVADSRQRAQIFVDIDVVTPNDREAGIATGIDVFDEESLERAGMALLESARNVFITRGPLGVTIFAQSGTIEDIPIRPVKAVDVTGAGDTAAAAILLSLAAGGTLRDAATIANAAAGVAVQEEGVVTINNEDVLAALAGSGGPEKLKTLKQLKPLLEKLRDHGRQIVWTNGCFDILHAGHITYLLSAREEGDVLVVGLNSDASVQAIKGPDRPVVAEQDRALVLSALECVDYLVIFDDPSPEAVIAELQPDVYAKGGDYTVDTIDQTERKLVEGYGGRIAIIPGVDGRSTSSIIAKILE